MKILIVYYSFSGTTKSVAETIALLTDGDLFELIPETEYDFSDNTTLGRIRNGMASGYCPSLIGNLPVVADYDVIFIGSPNWLKAFAPPALSFLQGADLIGKTVIPFCTHGGGGFGHMVRDLREVCPNSHFKEGLAVGDGGEIELVEEWLELVLGENE